MDNTDLIRRYCPGLQDYTHEQVAKHIPTDALGCWPWDGTIDPKGYGRVYNNGSKDTKDYLLVHRALYAALIGPIPFAFEVHHRCEYRACWHPMHLEAITSTEHRARHKKAYPVRWATVRYD